MCGIVRRGGRREWEARCEGGRTAVAVSGQPGRLGMLSACAVSSPSAAARRRRPNFHCGGAAMPPPRGDVIVSEQSVEHLCRRFRTLWDRCRAHGLGLDDDLARYACEAWNALARYTGTLEDLRRSLPQLYRPLKEPWRTSRILSFATASVVEDRVAGRGTRGPSPHAPAGPSRLATCAAGSRRPRQRR
jgi:hypothetical protein